jgi:hypothetical protein
VAEIGPDLAESGAFAASPASYLSTESEETKMSETEPKNPNRAPQRRPGEQPQFIFPVPKNMVYGTVAVVVVSMLVTFFVRNPYTQASTEGSLYYERGMETNMALWVVIFIGVPASFLAYKHWILPMLERRAKSRR